MKKVVLLLMANFILVVSYSQVAYQRGDNQLNFGINLGQGPGVYGSYEVGITDNISIGGEAGVGIRVNTYAFYGGTYVQGNFRFSGFADYHFAQLVTLPDEWDLYGGVDIGYSIWTKDNDNSTSIYYSYQDYRTSGFMIGAHAGGRWFWTDKMGVNVSFGGGYNYMFAKAGITMKLN